MHHCESNEETEKQMGGRYVEEVVADVKSSELFYRGDERYGLALETAVNPEIGIQGD